MFPTDPRQMQRMMKQLGIKSEEIEANEVIIKKKDGSELQIREPQVLIIEMQGQKSFQITGKISEAISEEDIKMVAQQTNKTEEEAKKALERNKGDIAKAILELQSID